MLGKLLKYEWKATGHSLLPLYLVVLAVSAVNSLMIHLGSSGPSPQMVRLMDSGLGEVIQLIGFMLYFGVIMALTVLTVVVIGQRFYKGVVGDEGYLVLTAPVGLWEIPLAKCLIGLVFGIFSMITAAASIIILMSPTAFVQMIREVDWILFFERLNLYVPQWALYAGEFSLLLVLAGATEIYHVYLAIMLGQLSNTHKAAFSFFWYVVINIVLSILSYIFLSGFNLNSLALIFADLGGHASIWASIGICALQILVFAGSTQYLMAKRMNV